LTNGSRFNAGQARSDEPRCGDQSVNRRLRAHYAWSDKRGELYADAYRSAYVLTYPLSALAVFVALLPMAAQLPGAAEILCVAVELGMFLTILLAPMAVSLKTRGSAGGYWLTSHTSVRRASF
jgi:hypothetical protein